MNSEEFYALQWTDGSEVKNHGIYRTHDEAYDGVTMWWKLNNYTPHYVRVWTAHNVTTIDYGLHEAFYKITKINQENFIEVMFENLKKESVKTNEKFDNSINNVIKEVWPGIDKLTMYRLWREGGSEE